MNAEAVIFDMDGVLVDTAEAHCASWQRLAADFGIEISRQEFLKTFGRPSSEIIRLRFPDDLTDEDTRRLAERKEAHYRELAAGRVKLIPHALDLLERLAEAGVRMAIGSSAPPENVEQVLDLFSLGRFFRTTVNGGDVSRGKPNPEVFLLAAERLGTNAVRCVVIEDAPAGIEAARAAGMTAIALTTSHSADAFPHAHRVVDSLAELRPGQLLALEP